MERLDRAIIIHCWDGTPNYCWYPWVKRELEARGFKVSVPAMPETGAPKLALWLPCLATSVGSPNENLYLIGHSAGCITILRYLETLKPHQRVGGAVLVAGFTDDLGYKEMKKFFETPIDFEKIKTKSKNGFVTINSDNDPYVDLKYADIFKEKLGTQAIIKHAMGHFSGSVDNESSCTKLPEVIE